MNRIWTLVFVVIVLSFSSCTVTESIVFNEDNSGEFLVSYDMGQVMSQMGDMFNEGGSDDEDAEKEKTGKVMDTMMVFSEIMETYKDSVAALPEEKRLAMEAVKDMYMKMHMDEDNGVFDFGIGMDFKSIDDLKNIQEKMRKVQSLNAQNDQVGAMKDNSPMGKFMGNDNNNVEYQYTDKGFARVTSLVLPEGADMSELEQMFDENDESNKQFMAYFEEAYYNVKLTFPKRVKSTSIEGAEISEDGKTVTYKSNWIDYLKNPMSLDVKVELVDE